MNCAQAKTYKRVHRFGRNAGQALIRVGASPREGWPVVRRSGCPPGGGDPGTSPSVRTTTEVPLDRRDGTRVCPSPARGPLGGTTTTGMLECSTSSRLVLPSSEPECSPDPRVPTTIKSTEYGCFAHSKQRRAGVAVDHEPLDRGRVHTGAGGYLTNRFLMWSDLSRESSVLQEAHSVNHLQRCMQWLPRDRRPRRVRPWIRSSRRIRPRPCQLRSPLGTPFVKVGQLPTSGPSLQTRPPLAPALRTWGAQDLPPRRGGRPKRRPSMNAVPGRCTHPPGTTPDAPGGGRMNAPVERAARSPPLRERAHPEDRPDGHRSHTTPGSNPARSDRSPGERPARKRVARRLRSHPVAAGC